MSDIEFRNEMNEIRRDARKLLRRREMRNDFNLLFYALPTSIPLDTRIWLARLLCDFFSPDTLEIMNYFNPFIVQLLATYYGIYFLIQLYLMHYAGCVHSSFPGFKVEYEINQLFNCFRQAERRKRELKGCTRCAALHVHVHM